MKFFVRFNQNNNQVFSIYSFNETVNKIGRTFSLNLVAKSPEEGGTLATVCSDFLVENSISKIEILNENEIVMFSSVFFHEASSFDVSFNADNGNIDYYLSFRLLNE